MKRSAIIFTLLISFIGGIIWYGKSLPELSHISSSQTFNRPTNYIWQLIFEYNRYPEWRENVYAIEIIPNTTKYEAWKEIDEDGNTTPYQLVEFNHNQYIIMEETGTTNKTSGKWHFEVMASEDGESSTLKITEDRLFPDLLPRVVNHLLNTSTVKIDAYFRSINNKIMGDVIRNRK
ncbi:MAG: hypothetical protein OQK46_10915 [Gammaproteobacteria bacterium]|nr:hypothetical protein [Gammaproteobacteria bacterium]